MPHLCLFLLLGSCVPYRDFTLPNPPGRRTPVAFRWEAVPTPQLTRGVPGQWDSADVLNPSVVESGGSYWNLYSGFDGKTWRTGLANSSDGQSWRKQGMVLAPDAGTWEGSYIAANGSALADNGQFFYWYQAGSAPFEIGLARSTDARNWRKEPRPVLSAGPYGSWDERAVADPYVVVVDGHFFLFYLGQDRARRQRLGVATSADGIHWLKLRSNPVLELGTLGAFDENGLGEPAVWASNGFYWMLYTGRDRQEVRRLGLARSSDGARWEKLSIPVIAGSEPWNGRVICDPTILAANGQVRVWFGGGNVAHPVENVNGQIGAGLLRIVPAGQ